MSRTIVVGYDGSDHATDALALGRLLARIAGARLLVACAYPEDPLGASATAAELARGVREDAEERLERARALVADDANVELRAVAGALPSRVLHELAEQLGAEAIVVGATHHGMALRLLTGSTPEHMLDHAPCPVAVAPEGFADRGLDAPRRIAVAYDGSPEAAHALGVAADLARRAGARLRLVTAINTAAAALYPPLDVTAYERLAGNARAEAQRRLEQAAAGLADVPADVAVLEGETTAALVEDSASEDLLFAGSRAHGPFRRVLVGSVSRHLLREAACPVVIVPRGSGEGA